MSRVVTITIFVACLFIAYGTGEESEEQENYFYFSYEARDAAVHLQKYLSDLDDKFEDYLIQLKRTNQASQALNKYKEVVGLTKGTECASKVTTDHQKAQKDIESIIDTCQSFVPHTDLQILSTKLKEAVAKVEMIDKTLRYHSKICSTEKATSSPKCIENKQNALTKLRAILSDGDKAKFEDYSKTAFSNIKRSLDRCVSGAMADLKEQVEISIKDLEECLHNSASNL